MLVVATVTCSFLAVASIGVALDTIDAVDYEKNLVTDMKRQELNTMRDLKAGYVGRLWRVVRSREPCALFEPLLLGLYFYKGLCVPE